LLWLFPFAPLGPEEVGAELPYGIQKTFHNLLSFPVNHLHQLSLILILDFSIKYRGSIFNYFIDSFLAYHRRRSREGLGLE
jgi:hypothetical protein